MTAVSGTRGLDVKSVAAGVVLVVGLSLALRWARRRSNTQVHRINQ